MSIINTQTTFHDTVLRNKKSKFWAIGGGKGGVGKSLVTANTSICLALMGYKVVTVDLDLGGANIHTCLGLDIPKKTLSDFVMKRVSNISELLIPTPIENLQIISGAQDELSIANLKKLHRNKLLSALAEIDADFILMDLGAGTTQNTLDFFISADKGILVVLPEPTSIENTYRFIKSVYYRKFQIIQDDLNLAPLVKQAMNAKMGEASSTPAKLIEQIEKINPTAAQSLKSHLLKFSPSLIMNQVRHQKDIDLGTSIKNVTLNYFGIKLNYDGYIDYDANVWQSVKKRKPLLLEAPNSKLVQNFENIVHKLLEIRS